MEDAYPVDAIKALIVAVTGKPIEEVTPEAGLIDDLGLDSLDVIQLEINLKEAFDVEISEKETDGLINVADVIELIKSKLAAAK